jgi:phenylacetate-CoA ligase
MIILRGVNLFPSQIEELILRAPQLAPHFECVLTRPGRMDELMVRVERRPEVDAADGDEAGAALVNSVKERIGVSIKVEVVAPEGIERSAGKARRLIDQRPKR